MRARRPWPLACLLPLLPALAAAQGQWSGSLVAASDERFRGRSLTGEQASLRATAAWDHASGAYGGASLSNARVYRRRQHAALVLYGGASGPLDAGRRWDAGLTHTRYASEGEYDYTEAYLGAGADRWGLRLSASPSYYGSGHAAWYAEAGWNPPLSADWQLQLHAGALRRGDGHDGTRLDARAALAWEGAGAQWQLAATTLGRRGPYPAPAGEHRQRWVASVTLPF